MENKPQKTTTKAAEATASTAGSTLHIIGKVLVTILLIGITTGLLFTCIFAYYVKTSLTSDLDVTPEDMQLQLSSTIYYTDADGANHELATVYDSENRVWVDYDNIPKYMTYAAVAIEDQRFYKHNGVDWYRTFGAFVNMFISMKNDFGGSTITQQLIKNVTHEDDITVQRKLTEIFRALQFERDYTKDEIMEWYLNVIYLGEGCYGVSTAAEAYFDKDVSQLDLAECASIIAITNNPSKYDPYISRDNNKARRLIILKEMYDQGYITYDEYQVAKEEDPVFKHAEDEQVTTNINSYYVETVINDVVNDLAEARGIDYATALTIVQRGGYQIYSCYDPSIQATMDAIYTDPTNFPTVKSAKKGESLQSAAVLMDPYTGEIKALVGGIGEKTANLILNRATKSQRSPGSSIKPIAVYGPAIDQGLITPSTLVNDADGETIKLSAAANGWYPNNAGGGNRGVITIQQALISSINTVSAQIMDKLTPSVAYSYLTERLGFVNLVDSDRNYAPMSLGQLTNGITVREMCQAYSAFVNDGVFTYGRTYTRVTDSSGATVIDNSPKTIVAFKANTAWTMCYMLNQAATYGTGSESRLDCGMTHAGKTGSSTNYCDRWFVGFTPYYVCAVWTGYDTPEYMSVSGNPAARVWKKIMDPVNEGLEIKYFKTPTLGGPTNIFDVEETPSPSPSDESSDEPTDSGSTPTPSGSPNAPDASTPVASTSPSGSLVDFIQSIILP